MLPKNLSALASLLLKSETQVAGKSEDVSEQQRRENAKPVLPKKLSVFAALLLLQPAVTERLSPPFSFAVNVFREE